MPRRQLISRARRAAFFLSLLLLLPVVAVLPIGAEVPTAPNVPDHSHAQAVILYNLDHKSVLLEKNSDKILFPASTVKIMTGFLASELLSDRMEETVTITADMIANASGNRMNLSEGEVIRLRDLYFGAVCGGYNDACTALAVIASGSVDAFVGQMNETATVLGMYDTVYKNPTGLHSSSMVTTARDTLALSLAASTDELYMEASSAVKHEIPATNKSGVRSFYNRNYLIASAVTTAYHNPYVEGLNGGMTDEGGWCLSAKAFRNDLTWFCVVLGGEEDAENGELYAYSIANTLLSWAARGYIVKSVASAGEAFGTVPVNYASLTDELDDGLPLVAKNDLDVFIPKNTADGEVGLAYTVRLHSPSLDAPIEAGAEAGTLIVTWNGTEVGRVTLLAERAVARNDFTFTLAQMKELPKNRVFQGFSVSFIILLTVYILRVSRFRYRHKRRAGAYVPIPFRDSEETEIEESIPPTPKNHPSRPAMSNGRKPQAPSDPYASAAVELERRKRK